MTDLKSPENQQELFSQFSQEPRRAQRFPSLAKSHKPILLSVTLEQILLAGILLILTFCLVFFLGLMRGRTSRSLPQVVVTMSTAKAQAPTLAQAPILPTPVGVNLQTATPTRVPAGSGRPKVTIDDPAKPYSIQLVTYKKKEVADREAGVLKRLGFFSTVIQRGDYYEVRAGQYATADEAKKDLAYFSSKYKGCFLCRR